MVENTVTLTDWIQAIASIVGIVISSIAIWHSRKSIEFSEKSIEITKQSIHEANRPVVVIYLDHISVYNTVKEYLVVKNFGNTQALIESITADSELSVLNDKTQLFTQTVPFTLAPNQSFSTLLDNDVFKRDDEQVINMKVLYSDTFTQYEESFILNQNIVKDMKFSKTNPSNNATIQKVVAHVSEELIRKNL